jgi:hypothetical protein
MAWDHSAAIRCICVADVNLRGGVVGRRSARVQNSVQNGCNLPGKNTDIARCEEVVSAERDLAHRFSLSHVRQRALVIHYLRKHLEHRVLSPVRDHGP